MDITHIGVAGTMESGDIYVEIEPGEPGVSIDLDSTVASQFGSQIRRVIGETLGACGVDGVHVHAVDKGALDCTIRARVSAAAYRSADSTDYNWR